MINNKEKEFFNFLFSIIVSFFINFSLPLVNSKVYYILSISSLFILIFASIINIKKIKILISNKFNNIKVTRYLMLFIVLLIGIYIQFNSYTFDYIKINITYFLVIHFVIILLFLINFCFKLKDQNIEN